MYDITLPMNPNSNKAVHEVCELMSNKRLELDYELGFYSESHVPSAPGLKTCTNAKETKFYEFMPVSQFKIYCRRTLITVKPETQASVLSGSIP